MLGCIVWSNGMGKKKYGSKEKEREKCKEKPFYWVLTAALTTLWFCFYFWSHDDVRGVVGQVNYQMVVQDYIPQFLFKWNT